MFEKTLTDIVKGIRASKRDTALYISQCIAEIKTEINSSDMFVKANALQKLTFLQMMGYGMSWASFATIEVMSSPRFAHKRVGYLAASQGFTQDTDVILLTTNLLKKELRGAIGANMNGVYEAGLAINCISNIVTEELAQDLLPELTGLTQHPQPYLRKKAILCLFKVFVKYPQGLRLTFAQIQQCLSDPTPAVVSCAVNVIAELSDKNARNYLHLAPAFFDLLSTTSNNWMLIKVVKLLGSLVPEEPRLARKLLEPLAEIVKNTPAKSLLYECVHTITLCLPYCRKSDGSMPASVPDIVALCAQTLKEFVEEKDQNLKYLGLVGFGSLMQSHPKVLSAPNYRPLILACLSDVDVTIRTRALGLLPSMASRKNIVELVSQLLEHVELASGDYKLELVRVIVEMCSGEKYALLPDFAWYLDTLLKLGHIRGLDTHAELLRSQVTDVALRVLPVRAYAVKRSIEVLLEGEQINADSDLDGDNGRGKHIMPEILPALAWIVGEYSDLIPEVLAMDESAIYIYNTESEGPYHSVVQVCSAPSNQMKLPPSTQKVYIQAGMKVFAAATANKQVSDVELEACSKSLLTNLPVFMQSPDPEVMERAFTAHSLLQALNINVGIQAPGLVGLDEDEDSDGAGDGNLLDSTGAAALKSFKSQKKSLASTEQGLAAKCRQASATLQYLLKPAPMKPSGAKAQRKKHQTPNSVGVDTGAPIQISIFSSLIEAEKSQRASSRLTMESVSFTQQRPLHVADKSNHASTNIGQDAVSSQDLPNLSSNDRFREMNGTGLSFQTSGGQDNTPLPRSNMGGNRPQTAGDPFYLHSGPAAVNEAETAAVAKHFGAIQLGDGDSDEEQAAVRHKKSKKKKKQKQQTVDVLNVFGAKSGALGATNNATVYISDDDDDDNLLRTNGPGQSRKGLTSREFHGLAKVDLTMPLRDDEVMPERKHRVVPERTNEIPQPESEPPTTKSKKKKKKESKKSKKASSSAQGGVGDLLDLAQFAPAAATTLAPAPAASFLDTPPTMVAASPAVQPVMQNNGNTIGDAFDDLLGFSNPTPVPLMSGSLPALTAPSPAVPDVFGGLSAPLAAPMATNSSSRYPWIRGTIKSSHASGPPVVDWSQVHLLFRLEAKGQGTTSIVVKVENSMKTSSLNGLSLTLKDHGNVAIGNVPPGSSAESTRVGPLSYPGPDMPLELRGTLSTSGCQVSVKLCLPVSAHFTPVTGLSMEDVARQMTMNQWSSFSAKLGFSGASPNEMKALLCGFLGVAEVEPHISGPDNGTFAGESKTGVQIRLLVKAKKGKLKLDLKTTNPNLGESIVADLKRLVL